MHKILNNTSQINKIVFKDNHKLPFVISISHSGIFITTQMGQKLKPNTILANMDWYLPELYDFLQELEFTIIINPISRYVIELNRNENNIGSHEYTKSLIYTAL